MLRVASHAPTAAQISSFVQHHTHTALLSHMRHCLASITCHQPVQVRHCSSNIMQDIAAPAATRDALVDLKENLRKQIKQDLKLMSSEDMQQQSSQIAEHVLRSRFFRDAKSVGLYVTCERLREVDTMQLLNAAMQQGKACLIPLVEDSRSNMSLLHIDTLADLQPAPPFGILEPSRQHPDGSDRLEVMQAQYGLDLLLLPGLGFDREGRRLGRGGGYYDKLVHLLDDRAKQQGWHRPWLVALAFEQQMVSEVPMHEHDRHVDVVATADGLIICSERAQSHMASS